MCVPTDAVVHKDIVIVLLSASATIAGLILVFVGLVVSAYATLPGDTAKTIKDRLRSTAGLTLVPFGLGLAQIVAATIWLLHPSCVTYSLTVILFLATVVAVAGAAGWTVRKLMWP